MTVNARTTNPATPTAQQIHQQIEDLPPESLVELADYLEFLRFKAGKSIETAKPSSLRLIRLRGLLKGYDFSPELLTEARREMWHKFQEQPV
jgi:hypothetical protein